MPEGKSHSIGPGAEGGGAGVLHRPLALEAGAPVLGLGVGGGARRWRPRRGWPGRPARRGGAAAVRDSLLRRCGSVSEASCVRLLGEVATGATAPALSRLHGHHRRCRENRKVWTIGQEVRTMLLVARRSLDAQLLGQHGRLDPAAQLQLPQQPADVRLHRRLRHRRAAPAISAFDSPSPRQRQHLALPAGQRVQDGRVGRRPRATGCAANSAISRRVTAGAIRPSPRATVRTASSRSVGVGVLQQEARRPPRAARRRRTRPGRRWSAPARRPAAPPTTCRVADTPSSRGICTSISTRSGRSSRARRTASSPSAASPTTSMSRRAAQDQDQPGAYGATGPRRPAPGSSCPSRPLVDGQLGPHQPDCRRPAPGPPRTRRPAAPTRSRMPTSPAPEPGARGPAGRRGAAHLAPSAAVARPAQRGP